MANPAEKLVLENVSKRFPGQDGDQITILRDITCAVAPGETVAIVGPSGSGKSTLLNIIGALEKPTSGTVRLGDTDVVSLEAKALATFRSSRVGFVFQDHHLLPQLTALENVLLPSLATGGDSGAEDRARSLLERVGLQARMDQFPSRLSGGERQRVALARALINEPSLLLCDEPTGNLDRQTGETVVSLLLELAEQHGVTVLMVTHNSEQAARFARCLQLRDGAVEPCADATASGESL